MGKNSWLIHFIGLHVLLTLGIHFILLNAFYCILLFDINFATLYHFIIIFIAIYLVNIFTSFEKIHSIFSFQWAYCSLHVAIFFFREFKMYLLWLLIFFAFTMFCFFLYCPLLDWWHIIYYMYNIIPLNFLPSNLKFVFFYLNLYGSIFLWSHIFLTI